MEYGLIGKTLKHSFSKEIHEAIGKYQYELIELDDKQFHTFMKEKKFKAINVTIPYKEKVIEYLDYISPEVCKIKACNTIINKNGLLYGYNTDYYGLKAMLNHFNINVNNKNAMILGTGGTSKTLTELLKDLNVKQILYVSRNRTSNTIDYDNINNYSDKIDVLFNTTPCEMYPNNDKEIISLNSFNNLNALVDVIYNPIRTNLILKAMDKGINCCGGLFMLIAQAIYAIELFKEITIDKNIIANIYNDFIKKKENIVLIGMPGCGKTTIGKQLAIITNKNFFDIDEEIIKIIKMPISDYFKLYGEEKFREIESQVIYNISKNNEAIIATGGGSVLKRINITNLKQNGKLYFIDRDLELLCYTLSRPLSSSFELLKKRYHERYDLYVKYCDIKLNGNESVDSIIKAILRGN